MDVFKTIEKHEKNFSVVGGILIMLQMSKKISQIVKIHYGTPCKIMTLVVDFAYTRFYLVDATVGYDKCLVFFGGDASESLNHCGCKRQKLRDGPIGIPDSGFARSYLALKFSFCTAFLRRACGPQILPHGEGHTSPKLRVGLFWKREALKRDGE